MWLWWLFLACTPVDADTQAPSEVDTSESDTDTGEPVDVEAVQTLYQDLVLPTLTWVPADATRSWMEQVVHAAQRVCGFDESLDDASEQTLTCDDGEDDSTGYATMEATQSTDDDGTVETYRYDEIFLRVNEDASGFWYSNGRIRHTRTERDGEVMLVESWAQVDVELPPDGEPLWKEGDLDQTMEVAWTRREVPQLVMHGHIGVPANQGFTGLLVERLRLQEDPDCLEPRGTVGLRDVDGTWFYATFEGPAAAKEDTGWDGIITEATCDGCGVLARHNVQVGEICLDFTPWTGVSW